MPTSPKGTVVAIGNFDGIHKGHQTLLKAAIKQGKDLSMPTGILTFKDHPRHFFLKDRTWEIIPLAQKLDFFSRMGFDFCVVSPATENILKMLPLEFMQEILKNRFNAKTIVVGDNFRFGQKAQGTVDDLISFQKKYNHQLIQVPLVKMKGEIVSSTRIRRAIKEGEFDLANRLLNRPVFISGKVIPGKKMGGAILGFPTANIRAPSRRVLPDGIYKVRVWLEHKILEGVMNTGKAPSVGKQSQRMCEIHLLNFKARNLYGIPLTFQVIKKIREEMKFDRLSDLVEQIKKDIRNVQQSEMEIN